MRNESRSGTGIHKFLLAALLFLPASLLAEPLTLKHAVELALKHANGIAIAAADEQHASASYRELRNSYIPQLTAGAGIGWSDGFPLSLEGAAPSLFNVNAQSALINPALKDFIRAAQSDVKVSALRPKISAIRSSRTPFSVMLNSKNGSSASTACAKFIPTFRKWKLPSPIA